MLVAQARLTLRDRMNYSPLGSSVRGILQARILEWVAIPFSRGSSQTRDWNLSLLHCQQFPYRVSYREVLLHCRQILYYLKHQESETVS